MAGKIVSCCVWEPVTSNFSFALNYRYQKSEFETILVKLRRPVSYFSVRQEEERKDSNKTNKMDSENIPITNNPRLIFIPYKTDSSPARGCPDQSNDACQLDDTCQDVDSFGKRMRDFFMSSYLYCLILGSISLMSGLLLSIIAFHGLNSNNITPIMGKEKNKST